MRKRVVLYSVLCLLLCLLDAAAPFTVFGVGPRYVLGAVVCIALSENAKMGSIFGLVFGLVVGFFSSLPFGVDAVLYGFVGFFAERVFVFLRREGIVRALLTAGTVTVGADLVVGIVDALLYERDLWQTLYYVTLPKTLLTLAATTVIFSIVRWVTVSKLWRNVDEEY